MEQARIVEELKEALAALNREQRAVTRQILTALIAELEKEVMAEEEDAANRRGGKGLGA